MRILNRTFQILYFAVTMILASCMDTTEKEDNSVFVETDTATEAREETEVETAVRNAKVIINAGQELIDKKRRRDSIRMAGREKMFAYQLGFIIKEKSGAVEAYKRLNDTKGVFILKKGKHKYLLVKFEDKDEMVLLDELDDYIAEHGDEITGAVKIIDLVNECGRHKKPVQDASIEEKRSDLSIDCLTCNSE
jgi:hypothetical protein